MQAGCAETFWSELSEISQQAQQAQADYQASRDALLLRSGAGNDVALDGLWADYCEHVARLKRVIADLGQATDRLSGRC
jgi:hypothetical protein